jgi:hypothetical protein
MGAGKGDELLGKMRKKLVFGEELGCCSRNKRRFSK